MMNLHSEFNFDDEQHIVTNSIPCIKSINKKFCGVFDAAGLWISNESLVSSGWRKSCSSDCDDNCDQHYVNTKEHNLDTQTGVVLGKGIISPRMCILRSTDLLKIHKGKIEGVWNKGDGYYKDEYGMKKYTCAKRFLVLFVDKENKLLHEKAIQLTAKGNFQVNFSMQLDIFKKEFQSVYSNIKRIPRGSMNELWNAMCIFTPTFQSEIVGKPPFQSHACITYYKEKITDKNWLNYCVGYDPKITKTIVNIYNETDKWNKFAHITINSLDMDSLSINSD
nr:MAG: hypothetical protein DiTV3a_F2ORF17 [Diabrotica toursvirus 3a]